MESELKDRITKRWENAFLIIYGIILIHHFLDTTMFSISWPPKTGIVLYFIIMVFTVAKLKWANDFAKKELILAFVVLAIFVLTAVISDYSFLFEVGFLIVGAKSCNFKKILQVYLIISSTIIILAMIASQIGWIENLAYTSERGIRNSFGCVYPTDFAAHIFYMIIAAACLIEQIGIKKEKESYIWKLFYAAFSMIAAILIYKYCAAYTSALCLGILSIAMLIVYIFEKLRIQYLNWKLTNILTYITFPLAIAFIVLAQVYREDSAIMVKMNSILSNRLAISHQGISEYGYSLMGQNIPEVGLGRALFYPDNYFFLDDSYIRILLEYGVILLVLVLVLNCMITKRGVSNGNGILFIALLMVALHCFMEQHMLEVAFNPFILCIFAGLVKREYGSEDIRINI